MSAYHLTPGGGAQHWWAPGLRRVEKATGAQTFGNFALTEVFASPGYTSPYHLHERDDEAIYVLAGEVELFVGNERYTGRAGSFTFMPRGVAHGYTVTSEHEAALHILMSPPGFERFFSRNAASVDERPSAAGLERRDAERVLREEYGIRLVDPPAGYPPMLEWSAPDPAV